MPTQPPLTLGQSLDLGEINGQEVRFSCLLSYHLRDLQVCFGCGHWRDRAWHPQRSHSSCVVGSR